ncbi:MAG: acetate/propionate family kinase [Rhodospirillales bacterium]|nr:acetate/propionate family kinase [Rhodospirillales bacterium]
MTSAAPGILVINAGSSSIKYAAYSADDAAEPQLLGKGMLEGIGTDPHFVGYDQDGVLLGDQHWPKDSAFGHEDGLRFLFDWFATAERDIRVAAAGHRVVHGGLLYSGPVRLDARVLADLVQFEPLAPLHQPHNLLAIRALAKMFPDLPQIACFDTAFHRTQPEVAQIFALPYRLSEQGIRRYGFHGLSYEYIARRMHEIDPGARRVVVAHLGSGASMCAMLDGRSVESSMGFTAVDGLMMGTRTGALDPGVVLYLIQTLNWDGARIEKLLYKESGLLGVSGLSNDMRSLLASQTPRAHQAVELFCYTIAKQLGALVATLGGIDALVFTAGIGERAAPIRADVCRRSEWLGIRLDEEANAVNGPRISHTHSPVAVWVVPTDEEKMIAIHAHKVLATS